MPYNKRLLDIIQYISTEILPFYVYFTNSSMFFCKKLITLVFRKQIRLFLCNYCIEKRLPCEEPLSYNMMAINPPEPSLMILSSVSLSL
jgi:hypothetical protein